MPVTEALDRVLEILRTTELYSPQFGAKDDDPHANDLVGGLVSVSVLTGCRLGPAALACFLRLFVDILPYTALFVCGVSQGLDHPLPRLSCPPAEPSPTFGLSGGGVGVTAEPQLGTEGGACSGQPACQLRWVSIFT